MADCCIAREFVDRRENFLSFHRVIVALHQILDGSDKLRSGVKAIYCLSPDGPASSDNPILSHFLDGLPDTPDVSAASLSQRFRGGFQARVFVEDEQQVEFGMGIYCPFKQRLDIQVSH